MNLAALTAYELIKEENLTDIHAKGYLLRHKKSGAKISLISNDDENKVFYIGFRTPVEDSTGVPHIIEHTVLCGSDKFPVKDPFVELVKGSLNTFLNAMTFPDKTVYPVASCIDKDFANLMDVYLDAVLHPNIYKKEEIFKQEGWHYELEDKDAPVTINGVVYNEMKGAFSSPEGVLDRVVLNSLFPDTTYSNESGGDPEVIPELTYEQYLDFHRKFYHPCNSYIYLYGNMDMDEKLEFLDKEYLSHYDKIEVDSVIQLQAPFTKPVTISKPYSIASCVRLEVIAYLSYNVAIGTNLESELTLAFDVLDYALLSAPGAPLKQALIDAGIGKDIMGGFDNSTLQPIFSVVAKNANKEDEEKFVGIIEDTLKKIVKDGLNRKSLLAGINSEEFKFREADYGNFPKGLIYGLSCMDSWLYDDDEPFLYLKILDVFTALKQKIETGYFEELIQKYLLDNSHKSYVSIEPEKGLNAKLEKELEEKLAAYKKSLSEEEIDKLVEDTKHLKQYQEEPSPKEDLMKIPMLKRQDMKREAQPLVYEKVSCNGIETIHTNIYSNGIHYLNLMFDISDITEEELPYLGVLKAVLGYMDTEHYNYADLANEINLMTGGISSQINIYADTKKKDSFHAKYEVRSKILYQNLEEGLRLLSEILMRTQITDEKRLYEILARIKSRLQMSLSSAGHSVSAMRAMSYFSPVARFNDLVGGIALYRTIAELEEHFDEKKQFLMDKLRSLAEKIFVKNRLLISLTADTEGYQLLEEKFPQFLTVLPDGEKEGEAVAFQCEKKNEGFLDASKVQYVSRAGNYLSAGYSYTGALRILKVILSYDYLWINVRVKGGAYGCMSGFMRNGDAYFTSYRDPNLKSTNEIYEGIPAYLRAFDADERDMTKYIIGTVSDMDTPLNPAAKGMRSVSAYLTNISYEELQRERNEVLDAQPENIKNLAGLIEAVLAQDALCVIGAEENVEAEKDMFLEVKNLY